MFIVRRICVLITHMAFFVRFAKYERIIRSKAETMHVSRWIGYCAANLAYVMVCFAFFNEIERMYPMFVQYQFLWIVFTLTTVQYQIANVSARSKQYTFWLWIFVSPLAYWNFYRWWGWLGVPLINGPLVLHRYGS